MIEVDDEAVVRLVTEQGRLRRNLGIQDIYKFLFQGVMGVAHILENKEKAWRELEKEFERVDVDEFVEEPLLERVSVDSSLVRVNLRPFKRLAVPLDGFFEVMLVSAERVTADKERFVGLWRTFMGLVGAGKLDFGYEALMKFDAEVRAGGYAPVHHSLKNLPKP